MVKRRKKINVGTDGKDDGYMIFYKKKFKNMWLKWPKLLENHKAHFLMFSFFVFQKLIIRHYYKMLKIEFKFEHTRVTKQG